jgi:hypothetical protein
LTPEAKKHSKSITEAFEVPAIQLARRVTPMFSLQGVPAPLGHPNKTPASSMARVRWVLPAKRRA